MGKRHRLLAAALAGVSLTLAASAGAAMYKWVDEKGKTHYGDRIPARYAKSTASKELNATGVVTGRTVPAETAAVEKPTREPTKAEIDRQRRDDALLATYANVQEIDDARTRELRTVNDWLARSTAGLAKSNKPEDRKKLDEAMTRARKDTDAINGKYDAYKSRFLELRGGTAPAAAAEKPRRAGDA